MICWVGVGGAAGASLVGAGAFKVKVGILVLRVSGNPTLDIYLTEKTPQAFVSSAFQVDCVLHR